MKQLILASSSSRRSELLTAAGLAFEVVRPDIDETPNPGEAADRYVMRLSAEKARAVAQQVSGDTLILAADTTVADGSDILGKPDDPGDAAATLRRLRGRVHFVYSGVSLLDASIGSVQTFLSTTEVTMRDYTDNEIAAYVASGNPMGKAGSYAIQNREFHPVARIQGCYTNVVGLPMCRVFEALGAYGVAYPLTCSPQRLPCQFDVNP